jgi:SAM-dependent methyltransferase
VTIFNNYARYYDLLYRDKDYAAEAEFIDRLIQRQAPNTSTILELGCGTGNHALLLAKAGYYVHGVDLSTQMLEYAKERCDYPQDRLRQRIEPELAAKLQFSCGDLRQVRLDIKFDVILSLFHVISYQTTNADLLAALETVKTHLKPGGIFIFDVWYGPAVLSDPPTIRIKRLEDKSIQVTRIAEPIMYPNENLVDVNYQVFIKDKNSGAIDELTETHRMRYLFRTELELLLNRLQMYIIEDGEWLTHHQPGLNTWGVYFVVGN